MDRYETLVLLFLGFSFSSCSYFPERSYHYINLPMNWTEAQHHCREHYTDLATIQSMEDISRLTPGSSGSWSWIGLKDDPQSWKTSLGDDRNSWRWSATGETNKTGYHNWGGGEPNSYIGIENCVGMWTSGRWFDVRCTFSWTSVCYNVTDQNEKTYTFISTPMTWESAQAHCREHHTDLATIETSEEHNEVRSVIPGGSYGVWIGLYREPWTWSDKTQSSFRHWASQSPDNAGGNQFCVAEHNDTHGWDDYDCETKLPFICHKDSEMKTVVKMKMVSDADLTDPATNAQILEKVVRMKLVSDADLTDPATNAQILEKLSAELRRQGFTNFTLRWKTTPRKKEKTEL